jgi:LAO/AO transport system kinase
VRAIREQIRAEVLSGELPATIAADRLLAAYDEPVGAVGRRPE